MANGFAPSGTATYTPPYHTVPGTLTIDSYPSGGYEPVAADAKIAAESDVKSVRKDGAAIAAATYVATASPSQIDLGADLADDVDLLVTYDATGSNRVDLEAATSDDVGTVDAEYIGD